MQEKKTRPTNQTIDELFDEYSLDLDQYVDTFALKYGYLPKDPTSFDYPFCPPEVQEMSWQFWTDPHIMKLETLENLFGDIIQRL